MKKTIFFLLTFVLITLAHATATEITDIKEVIPASIYFDADNSTIEINIGNEQDELEGLYYVVIKNREGEIVMDFKTNVSYNLINTSAFKKGKYTYLISYKKEEIKNGKFRIKNSCNR